MTNRVPYRAAGTYAGPSYIRRNADLLLLEAIQNNQRYPYIVAPRQSGKSSLLLHVRNLLDLKLYRHAMVDLSTYDLSANYDSFWRSILEDVSESTSLSHGLIQPRHPEKTFSSWFEQIPERLVVFFDEIDALLSAAFREQFFSKLRSLFNKRAEQPSLERLTIVLAGAAHPAQLINDRMRSPFNVGLEIVLDELSRSQVELMTTYLEQCGALVASDISKTIHYQTSGSVYLCQLILEHLWTIGATRRDKVTSRDVENITSAIINTAPNDIHFSNIYKLITENSSILASFSALLSGTSLTEVKAQDLRVTGLSDGVSPFRNPIYERVFGRKGPLDLVRLAQPNDTGTSSTAEPTVTIPPSPIFHNATDEELIQAFQRGVRQAGDILSKRHLGRLRRWFSASLPTNVTASEGLDIDDLVQSTMVAALYHEVKPELAFGRLLLMLARNSIYKALPPSRRLSIQDRQATNRALTRLRDPDLDLETILEVKMGSERIRTALVGLRLSHQMILYLVYWEGFSLPEVSEILEIPPSSVRSQLVLSRKVLYMTAYENDSREESADNGLDWATEMHERIVELYGDKYHEVVDRESPWSWSRRNS